MGTSIRYNQSSLANRKSAQASGCGCAECGGLECLCRPRFFAGQLLTEEEFNRLDRYIVQKNRLHNRYLHGWGVVCGLDVICNDCGSGVIVKEGYALSPCGDDIVVCDDTAVDICALINACKKKERSDCGSPETNAGCDETQQQWVLAVCYSETASRGMTPLRNSGSSGTGGCGCGGQSGHRGGGKSSGGCGCGGNSSKTSAASFSSGYGSARSATTSTSAKSCTAPLQCEPTVLCEGYSFRVYPAPRTKSDGKTSGAMVDRFQECFQDLVSVFTELPEGQPTPQQLHDWCCDTKAALLEYLETHPGYDCQLRRSVSQIICPSVNQEPSSFLVAFELTRQQLTAIAGELMFACLCRALMPPCPGPVTDDCVPLAVVTVNRSEGCRVESICNWTTLRKYATTFPNLQYWLSILPFGRTLRESLERFCCSGGGLRDLRQPGTAAEVDPTTGQPGTPVPVNNVVGETAYTANTAANGNPVGGAASGTASMNTTVTGATVGAATSGASATGASATGASTAARSAAGASAAASAKRAVLADISPSDAFRPSTKTLNQNIAVSGLAKEAIFSRRQSVDAQTLLFGMMGQKNDKGQDYLSTTQRENLAQFFILDQMAKPMLRSILPSQGEPLDLSELMRTFSAMSVGATPAKPETSTDVSPNTSSGATTLNTNVDLANTSPARASMAAAGTSAAGTSTASTATARTSAASQPAASDPVATAELRIQVKELSETVKRQQAVIDQLTQLVPGVKAATVESATAKSATAKSATAKSATAKSATAKSATAESAVTKSATAKSTTTKSSGTNRAAAKSTDKTSDNSAAKPKGNVKRRPGPSNS